jgi:hypothetical protein
VRVPFERFAAERERRRAGGVIEVEELVGADTAGKLQFGHRLRNAP